MRRRHVLVIILFIVSAYLSAWYLSPTYEINMLVIDKTVPEPDYREHRAIFWVAEHYRYTDQHGNFRRPDSDYLGFHPDDNRKDYLSEANLVNVKLLYVADTYGIYTYEEGLEQYEKRLPFEYQPIELIYGGLTLEEVNVIATFASQVGHTLIGEHNIFGYPTYLDQEASLLLQELFAVSYTGWLVRYYSDLDETAFWMKELYSRIYGLEWDLQGPGMVFVREDATGLGWYTDLVIVTRDDLESPWPVISCIGHELMKGAEKQVPYLYWMEVLEPDEKAEVLAYYELPISAESFTALKNRGLPDRRIPAVVYYRAPGAAERIYFAGDFADQLPALISPRLTGSAVIQRLMSYMPGLPVEYRFYFQWYSPVLRNILDRARDCEQ